MCRVLNVSVTYFVADGRDTTGGPDGHGTGGDQTDTVLTTTTPTHHYPPTVLTDRQGSGHTLVRGQSSEPKTMDPRREEGMDPLSKQWCI